jgi:hypothetical protein
MNIPNPFDIDELWAATKADMSDVPSSSPTPMQPSTLTGGFSDYFEMPSPEFASDNESQSTMPDILTNEPATSPSWATSPTLTKANPLESINQVPAARAHGRQSVGNSLAKATRKLIRDGTTSTAAIKRHQGQQAAARRSQIQSDNKAQQAYDARLTNIERALSMVVPNFRPAAHIPHQLNDSVRRNPDRLAAIEQALITLVPNIGLAAVAAVPNLQAAIPSINTPIIPLSVRLVTFDGTHAWGMRATLAIDAQMVASDKDVVGATVRASIRAGGLVDNKKWDGDVFSRGFNHEKDDKQWKRAGSRAISQIIEAAKEKFRHRALTPAMVPLKVMVYEVKDEVKAYDWIEGTYIEDV